MTAGPESIQTSPRAPIHVLIVDDDSASCRIMERDLRAAGYDVSTATTFYEALDLVEATSVPIDILVTDLQLDRGNGVALSRMARLRRPGLPTIFVTGYDIDGDVSFLRKPVLAADLCRAVDSMLKRCA